MYNFTKELYFVIAHVYTSKISTYLTEFRHMHVRQVQIRYTPDYRHSAAFDRTLKFWTSTGATKNHPLGFYPSSVTPFGLSPVYSPHCASSPHLYTPFVIFFPPKLSAVFLSPTDILSSAKPFGAHKTINNSLIFIICFVNAASIFFTLSSTV